MYVNTESLSLRCGKGEEIRRVIGVKRLPELVLRLPRSVLMVFLVSQNPKERKTAELRP